MVLTIKFGLGVLLICSLLSVTTTSGEHLILIPGDRNVRKFINGSYFASCRYEGSSKAEWFNPKHQKIDISSENRIRVENEADLFLTRIELEDAGIYTCATARGRASFALDVIRPIVFDHSLAEQSASVGSTYKMKCAAEGHSKPRIFWKVNQKKPEAPKYTITKDYLLVIHNVTQEDSRVNYLCRAMDMESPIPDARAMNITLKVKSKPQMAERVGTEYWGVLGEWANLTCAVHAEPHARFEWTHGGRTIPRSEEAVFFNEDNISILQVLVRSESTFGEYSCKARNAVGILVKTLVLNKAQKPSTPVLDVEVTAPDGARIRVKQLSPPQRPDPMTAEGTDKGKALPITGYVVQYKVSTQSDWKMAYATKFDAGFTVKKLNPGTSYQIRAASKNAAAVGEFSQPITVITSRSTAWSISDPPKPNPANPPESESLLKFIFNFAFVSAISLL